MAEKNDTGELSCTICLDGFTEPKVLPCVGSAWKLLLRKLSRKRSLLVHIAGKSMRLVQITVECWDKCSVHIDGYVTSNSKTLVLATYSIEIGPDVYNVQYISFISVGLV